MTAASCVGAIGRLRVTCRKFHLEQIWSALPQTADIDYGGRWSAVNRSSAQHLIEAGRMSEAGLREIEAAKADGRWETAYASQSKAQVPRDLLDALAANPAARQKFSELDSANRFAVIYRIQDAKKADTRTRRIAQYVEMLAHGKTLHPPKRPSRGGAKRGASRRIISPSSQ
jgi:hypothetical protein